MCPARFRLLASWPASVGLLLLAACIGLLVCFVRSGSLSQISGREASRLICLFRNDVPGATLPELCSLSPACNSIAGCNAGWQVVQYPEHDMSARSFLRRGFVLTCPTPPLASYSKAPVSGWIAGGDAPNFVRWEYKVLTTEELVRIQRPKNVAAEQSTKASQLAEALNVLGEDGWELVTVLPPWAEPRTNTYYLKRLRLPKGSCASCECAGLAFRERTVY